MLEDDKKNGKVKVGTKEPVKKTTTRTHSIGSEEARIKKNPGSFVSSKDWVPITARTYALETRRRGNKDYKIVAGKHFKANTIAKSDIVTKKY